MITCVKYHGSGAGKWIYNGIRNAWEDAVYFYNLADLQPVPGQQFRILCNDSDIQNERVLGTVAAARAAWIYAQPNEFPSPWGMHPNFQCHCPDEMIDALSAMDNVHFWTFGDTDKYHTKWKGPIVSVPLAYDNIGYDHENLELDKTWDYDVCFIGGWADNGFNEKMQIMKEYFMHFKESGLRCGIFVNRGISDAEEANIMARSKVAINIHDAYQRKLGLDTNERTFKALGICGALVSDEIGHISRLQLLGDGVIMTPNADSMVEAVKALCMLPDEQLRQIKAKNRQMILDGHTYSHRASQMMEVENATMGREKGNFC